MFSNIYGFLLLVALLTLGEARRHCHGKKSHHKKHHRHDINDDPATFFKSLADDVISLDKKSSSFCNHQHTCETKEIYNDEKYTIIAPLQNVTQDDIEVKIKHRVIFIHAEEKGDKSDSKEEKEYAHVRVLPNFVRPNLATWSWVNEGVVVEIPYLDDVQVELKISCENNFDEKVIKVPKASSVPTLPNTVEQVPQ